MTRTFLAPLVGLSACWALVACGAEVVPDRLPTAVEDGPSVTIPVENPRPHEGFRAKRNARVNNVGDEALDSNGNTKAYNPTGWIRIQVARTTAGVGEELPGANLIVRYGNGDTVRCGTVGPGFPISENGAVGHYEDWVARCPDYLQLDDVESVEIQPWF